MMAIQYYHLFLHLCAAPINFEEPNIIDQNNLILTWVTPPSVLSQGVEQYVIDVTSRCFVGDNVVNPQQFVVSPVQAPTVTVPNLRKWYTIYLVQGLNYY